MENVDIKIIEKTLQKLEKYAKEKSFVNYGVLYQELDLDRENPSDRNRGAHILAEVNRITMKEKDVMISAIVTLSDEQSPTLGFFEFAIKSDKLEENVGEDEKMLFWAEQVKKIFKTYKLTT